jgi:tryptophanyl-tRNA synthetase
MSVPSAKKTVFSGIQPSGEIHVGNYLGAVVNWVRLIDSFESIFCIVDQHALTVEYDPSQFQARVLAAAAVNIAAGLDPERATLFVQSHVPEHTELAWYFNTVTRLGLTGLPDLHRTEDQSPEVNVPRGFAASGLP